MQKHDLGYQKRQKAKPPLEIDGLKLLRAKRLHPGPLPERNVDKDGEEESDGSYARRILGDFTRIIR